MSYPLDLDEYDEKRLIDELARRVNCARKGSATTARGRGG